MNPFASDMRGHLEAAANRPVGIRVGLMRRVTIVAYGPPVYDVTRTSTDIPRKAPAIPADHRCCLPDVTRDGDGDQVEAADTAVRRIEGNPARARHIDFRPGMG
jgi:hypothetical protein